MASSNKAQEIDRLYDLSSTLDVKRPQQFKVEYLINKGGVIPSTNIEVLMPDGTTCAVDQFGGTSWKHK